MHAMHEILISPIITEKSSTLKEGNNTVAFKVLRDANKIEIKIAIEKLLKVKVLDVRSVVVRGKKKRVGKSIGMTPKFKKVYVTLAKDAKLSYFEGA